ncbi:MAG: acyl-CoA/acyl-ACP dehydrogenase [Ilumatobacteraceae bacterium]|nr:acyl-CoA/acyl-ACP dehydrogenase [Ilumatobacteraceae bacterium]
MRFAETAEQDELRATVRRLFDSVTVQPLLSVGDPWAGGEPDLEAWSPLADIGVLSAGSTSGPALAELVIVFEELGRSSLHLPLLTSVVCGSMPLRQFGGVQHRELVAAVENGETRLTSSVIGQPFLDRPLELDQQGSSLRLSGQANLVLDAAGSTAIVALGTDADANGSTMVVAPLADTTIQAQKGTDGLELGRVDFAGVEISENNVVGQRGQGQEIWAWVRNRARLCLAATMLGSSVAALDLTANYVREREQFGKPLAAFQAVSQRAADSYVDVEGMKLATWNAVTALEAGREAERSATIAAFWASEAGQRVAHSAQHLHGGIGVDISYPVHRHFLNLKQNAMLLGPPSLLLEEIGELLPEYLAESTT